MLGDVEAALLELAVQQQPRTGHEPVREPGPVEPDGLHLAARIDDIGLEDREASASGGPQLRALDLDLDRRFLPQPQIAEADRVRAVAVAVREVAEQVA